MTLPVLTVTGARWETELVSSLERSTSDVDVVRRCVDLPDLLATAASGQARAVLVSADLRRLDREAVARLMAGGVAVIGVVDPEDKEGAERLYRLGIGKVVHADAPSEVVAGAVAEAVQLTDRGSDLQTNEYVFHDPRASLPAQPAQPEEIPHYEIGVGTGQMIAVWGPTGGPGRTSVAVTMATELSLFGVPTLLADADVYGGVVAQALGLLEEAPGLAAACKSANNGSLDLGQLARHAREVLPRMRVLTGLPGDRWTELRAAALEQVWDMAKQLAAATVVDCGFSLEQDEELSFDTAAPRRNGATLTTIEAAHTTVVVGSADPIGLQRMVRGIQELRETVPTATIRAVVNGVRNGPIGSDPENQIRQALARYAGVDHVVTVPYDRASFDKALAAGRTLAEVAPSSPARAPIRRLAADLMGITLTKKRKKAKAKA